MLRGYKVRRELRSFIPFCGRTLARRTLGGADEVVKAKNLGLRLIAAGSFVKTKEKTRQPGNEDLQPELPNGKLAGQHEDP